MARKGGMKKGYKFPYTRTYKSGPKPKDKAIMFMEKAYPEPNTGCWLWFSIPNSSGYGRIDKTNWDGFNTAHRWSYFHHFGDFDRTLLVCHKCDNPACVNPDHLFLGTPLDNMTDQVKKGRSPRGEKNPKARMSEFQIKEIRSKHSNGVSLKKIREEYNIGNTTVSDIVNRNTWKFVN